MRYKRKNGFTLVELTVVLVIFAIIMAIASPFFIRYWRAAEFRKNESNARTVYLAAESKLTWYRTSGQWEEFKKEIKEKGITGGFQNDPDLKDRIYAITLDSSTYGTDQASGNPVLELLDDATYDKDNLHAAIAIEIDIETGEVYSAFYGTKCAGLNYDQADSNNRLTMNKRDYDSRRQRLLGYYSTEDTVNVVELDPVRLRIMTISLLNSEKLSLNWSSNVGSSKAVSYVITFYKKEDNSTLFSLTMSPYDMTTEGWTGESGESGELAVLTLKDSTEKDKGNWCFPVTYSDNKYSLVLDAMMSAKTMAALNASANKAELEKTSSTSICRLNAVASALADPQNVYATVKAVSYAGNKKTSQTSADFQKEYRDSEPVSSNVANTMYGDETKGTDVEINTFRHLSNIRYYEKNKAGTFTLTAKNMDWNSVGTGLYDADNVTQTPGQQRSPLRWQESSTSELDFPSVSMLDTKQTLKGNGNKTLISNLRLGETSVISDNVAYKVGIDKDNYSEYLGLFSEISGNVQNITLKDSSLKLTTSEDTMFSRLKGIGILAGRIGGQNDTGKNVVSDVTVTVSAAKADESTVDVDLSKVTLTSTDSRTSVGGITGVLASRVETSGYQSLQGSLKNATMEGRVVTKYAAVDSSFPDAPNKDSNKATVGKISATGGIAGYAWLSNHNDSTESGKLDGCVNHASVFSNLSAGGIVGFSEGGFNSQAVAGTDGASFYRKVSDLLNCSNDGLILSTADASTTTLEGKYFGGITGYARNTVIYSATSASGRAKGFSYDSTKKELLKGNYVGGIVGYGDRTVINSCSTEKNGYVLGSDYVGGIAGGLGNKLAEAIRADDSVSVTTNGNYVIGNNYVGGITGINNIGIKLKNCVNNGVAASYQKYAGGIVGYNENGATIHDCASYLSDYDNSVFNMIVDKWKATGDYAGGIAGYNDGKIEFTKGSEAITVKSVSSIIVGNNYVGGVAGFNDVNGELDVHYTLIGGRVYGYEDAVGGCFGLNASEKVLGNELVIKPRSVEGRYYVGGVIGANVVNLSQNVTMDQYRAENSLGSIKGTAFVGGLIGYQRTYVSDQLTAASDGSIRESLEANRKKNSDSDRILPTLDKNLVPTVTVKSANTKKLTITTKDNEKSFDTATNNIPIQASLYAGGIVGYCEKDSDLVIKDCWNKGSLSLVSGSTDDVKLADFIHSQEVGRNNLPSDTEKIDLYFVGGIIGVNLENQVVDHCANTGTMSGFAGIGGIVGLNSGLIYNCNLNDNFGNTGLSYLGGIASVNIRSNDNAKRSYEKVSYYTGTIQNCRTAKNKTVSGKHTLGGIVAWNMLDGTLKQNSSLANITGTGNYVGGVAGRNGGSIEIKDESNDSVTRTIRSNNGSGVGGVVGLNEAKGTILIDGTPNKNEELTAVGTGVTVTGYEKVGGIVGINQGSLGTEGDGPKLASDAKQVRATHGYAGGVVGTTSGNLNNAVNRSDRVSADAGTAGGITALNDTGKTISSCTNYGNVSSSNGHAGGIVAENKGIVKDCTVEGEDAKGLTIYSRGVDETGAVCAVNTGKITGSKAEKGVELQSSASVFGGVVGTNKAGATVADAKLTYMPTINSNSGKSLTVGGAAGQNDGTIQRITTDGIAFEDFTNYQYLGGIAGTNGLNDVSGTAKAQITDCTFSGTITEAGGAAGNCYGGIAGINGAILQNCNVGLISMNIKGVYTATSTSTAEQKEAQATHAGGITGKNEESGQISGCTLENNEKSVFRAQYGMLGGVTGFNKGTIEQSGSSITPKVITDEVLNDQKKTECIEKIHANATAQGLEKDSTYIKWDSNSNVRLEDRVYNGTNTKVSTGRLQLCMDTNGNVGGITAFNATTGELTGCVSGNWFLANNSEAIGVGTGGIIGMNESEKDLSFLVNGAFVGRKIKSVGTDRFAGGIIGNQNNSTSSDWTISDCINYGTVYCYNSHYSGGIMGQWTGTGGTIENCRNYGNMQTTYQAGWIGASGGIVAQLYHANENNEYNIISCGNYGNLYKREGSGGDGANDSAGILGNITNYQSNTPAESQKYTVQILDCVNGPGVEIYSSSMASGIFGFLSSDNANGDIIRTSTYNTVIRVERCRNFAKKLNGDQFVAGIFGDRYTVNAWRDHTIVKDNYSLNLNWQYYNKRQYPIYSARSSFTGSDGVKNEDVVSYMPEENRKGNFYFEGAESWGYTNVRIGNGTVASNGSGSAGNGHTDSGLSKFYTTNAFFMYDLTKKKYFLADIKKNGTTINGNSCYINDKGQIVDRTGTVKGYVLFYIEDQTYNNESLVSSAATDVKDTLFLRCREAYRRLEGAVTAADGTQKLLAPKKVTAGVADGKITITITPELLPYADGTYDDRETGDPFMYIATITDNTGRKVEQKLYSEEESFTVPSGLTGELTISVRAVSMYDDVQDSDDKKADNTVLNPVLPNPDVRVQVVKAGNGHTYEYSLNNLEDYSSYPDWQVQVTVQRVGTIILDAKHPTGNMNVTITNVNDLVYQMVAKASIKAESSTKAEDSQEISTSVNLPCYMPSYVINSSGEEISKNVILTGETLDNLSIEVELDASNKNKIPTPPIYRAELIGTWTDTDGNTIQNAVLAKTDILTVSQGKASASFSGLSEYIGDATDLKVRIWYAASGLGPVYAYGRDQNSADATVNGRAMNVFELVSVEEDENGQRTEEWNYTDSSVLDDNEFYKYRWSTATLFDWLDKPVLVDADSEELMTPDHENGRLYYTFSWDQTPSTNTATSYEVSLTGIDAEGREVNIPTDAYYTDSSARTLRIDGMDWNYQSVKLKVTGVGNTTGTRKKVGRSSTGTYRVKARLETPGAPTVTIADENELNYTLTWSPISSETGCDSYQVYVQPYYGSELAEAVAIGDPVPVTEEVNGTYTIQRDLEDYAGQKIVIYVVAKATANGAYLDSLPGITTEITVPDRLAEPKVTWNNNWKYDRSNPLAAAEFRNDGMQVGVTANNAASIPPGGSTYLLRAYIYDSKEAADTADPTQAIACYPLTYGDTGVPAQMEMQNATNYYHNLTDMKLQYAGKWMVFYARISSGSGSVSSSWTTPGQVYRLPYVKLDAPTLNSDTQDTKVTVNVADTPYVPGTDMDWAAERTAVNWQSVDGADLYELRLYGKDDLSSKVRISENTDSVQVEYETEDGTWKSISASDVSGDSWTYEIHDYQVSIKDSYTADDGSIPYYALTLTAELAITKNENGYAYTLILPDVEEMRDELDAVVDNDDFQITEKVKITSDVQKNLDGTSDAFVASETAEVTWNR